MTKAQVLALAEEMKVEEKKTQKKAHYYKRNGKYYERSWPEYIYTERYKYLAFSEESPLATEKVFVDAETGKTYCYNELEKWACNFDTDYYISSEEYEDIMGEDL